MPRLNRRTFLKALALNSAAGVVALPATYLYTTKLEPNWLDVETIHLTLPRLDPAFNGYRLVQISDLHLDVGIKIPGLESAVEKINELQPDAVAITGDYITYQLYHIREAYTRTLQQLQATDGVVGVLGNHDHWHDLAGVRQLLQDSGIANISNGVKTIRRGEAQLHLCGVDDVWEEQDRLDLVMESLPNDGAAILLAHEPDFADESAATGRFDLQLSGHTHGGQIRLPFIGAPILPTLGIKYPIGLYEVNGMYQYTNRGLGMIEPAVRLNCRPEITLFILQAPSA